MGRQLAAMMADLGETQAMSVRELHAANPDLARQLRASSRPRCASAARPRAAGTAAGTAAARAARAARRPRRSSRATGLGYELDAGRARELVERLRARARARAAAGSRRPRTRPRRSSSGCCARRPRARRRRSRGCRPAAASARTRPARASSARRPAPAAARPAPARPAAAARSRRAAARPAARAAARRRRSRPRGSRRASEPRAASCTLCTTRSRCAAPRTGCASATSRPSRRTWTCSSSATAGARPRRSAAPRAGPCSRPRASGPTTLARSRPRARARRRRRRRRRRGRRRGRRGRGRRRRRRRRRREGRGRRRRRRRRRGRRRGVCEPLPSAVRGRRKWGGKCRICGDKLKFVWDKDEQEWMYVNAARVSASAHASLAPEGAGAADAAGGDAAALVHQSCYAALDVGAATAGARAADGAAAASPAPGGAPPPRVMVPRGGDDRAADGAGAHASTPFAPTDIPPSPTAPMAADEGQRPASPPSPPSPPSSPEPVAATSAGAPHAAPTTNTIVDISYAASVPDAPAEFSDEEQVATNHHTRHRPPTRAPFRSEGAAPDERRGAWNFAVSVPTALMCTQACRWRCLPPPFHHEAPADEPFALSPAVIREPALELLFLVQVIVEHVLRHLLLRQDLHQDVLLDEVRAEAVNARSLRSVEEDEANLVGNVLHVLTYRVVVQVVDIELVLHPDHVDPLTQTGERVLRVLANVVDEHLEVELRRALAGSDDLEVSGLRQDTLVDIIVLHPRVVLRRSVCGRSGGAQDKHGERNQRARIMSRRETHAPARSSPFGRGVHRGEKVRDEAGGIGKVLYQLLDLARCTRAECGASTETAASGRC